MRALLLGLLLVAAVPSIAVADDAAGCHCYRQRTFDRDRPWAVDRYILATARSSLLSAAFGVDKRSLVQSVMTGTAPDDIWIAYWAAARTQTPAHQILALRRGEPSWAAALRGSAAALGKPLQPLVSKGARDSELAAAAVDDVVVRHLRADPAVVRRLRSDGATTEQVVLANVLAPRLNTPATELVSEVKNQKSSWGAIMDRAGIAPADLDAVVRQQFR